MNSVILTKEELNVEALRKSLSPHPCCGALVQFEGIVRDHHEGKKVVGIEYECFQEMAKKELGQIIKEAKEKWPIHEVLVAHRMGRLSVQEMSLLLLVMAPHRKEAFEAGQYIINSLKKRVPIWKKEFYEDGKGDWIACQH